MEIRLSPERLYEIFVHRQDVFATQQSSGAYFPTKRPLLISDIKDHIAGKITIGVYCLKLDNTVKWACIDIDSDASPTELRRMDTLSKYYYSQFPDFGRMREFSGRKGYHVWIFFKKPVNAGYAQLLIKARLRKFHLQSAISEEYGGFHHEVFPKQTELNQGRKYGNLVKLPHAIHRVNKKPTIILEMEGI